MAEHRIDELKKDIEIPEIVQTKANDAFRMIMEGETEEQHNNRSNNNAKGKSRRTNWKRSVSIALVAAVSVGVISVAAATYLNWSRDLNAVVTATDEQKIEADQNGLNQRPDEEHVTGVSQDSAGETGAEAAFNDVTTVTNQGVTVTADQVLVDKYTAYVSLKVAGVEFLKAGEEPQFEVVAAEIDGAETSWSGGFYNGLIQGPDGKAMRDDGTAIDWENVTTPQERYLAEDGSLQYTFLMMNMGEPGAMIGKRIHISLKNLGTVEKTIVDTKVNGEWELSWVLKGTDQDYVYDMDTAIGDTGATVKQVEITPITMRIVYDWPYQTRTEKVPQEDGSWQEFTVMQEAPEAVGVKMKDGTLNLTALEGAGTGGYASENSSEYTRVMAAQQILNPQEIAGVLFTKNADWSEGGNWTEEDFWVVPLK